MARAASFGFPPDAVCGRVGAVPTRPAGPRSGSADCRNPLRRTRFPPRTFALAFAFVAGALLTPSALAHGEGQTSFVGPIEITSLVTREGGPVSFGALAPGAEVRLRHTLHAVDGRAYDVRLEAWEGGDFADVSPASVAVDGQPVEVDRAFRVPEDAPRGDRSVGAAVLVSEAGHAVAQGQANVTVRVGAPVAAEGVAAAVAALVFAAGRRAR